LRPFPKPIYGAWKDCQCGLWGGSPLAGCASRNWPLLLFQRVERVELFPTVLHRKFRSMVGGSLGLLVAEICFPIRKYPAIASVARQGTHTDPAARGAPASPVARLDTAAA